MAQVKKSHPKNVPGPLFVDTTCIDCGTCFHLGPDIFRETRDDKSAVIKQPASNRDWQEAKRAILSCPTNSIGVKDAPEEFKVLSPGLPLLIADHVFYLGYTSRNSFGASSYLIQRPEGNILVDSPRYHPWLVEALEKLGGVKKMFLSHQDDVADHKLFAAHFGCERIIHADEVTSDTENVETIVSGVDAIELDDDLKIIMTPGHTKGHMCLLFQHKFLFTGDHIFVDQEHHLLQASKGVCWYSWEAQIQSVEKLSQEKLEWILPGHGGWGHFPDQAIKIDLKNLLK
jgi:glyoxylase-like metal-dependent hydrolase (beta-lactamase superfamily II)/ferredoxin